jgi:small-conductance mechanosensitive channel
LGIHVCLPAAKILRRVERRDQEFKLSRSGLARTAYGTHHPQVLPVPPPAVYLMGLGDIGIDFELRCLLANVEQSLAVRTDLQMEILRRFREAVVKIPTPVHDTRIPGPAPPLPDASPVPSA